MSGKGSTTSNGKPVVGLLMGSQSDWPVLQDVIKTLQKFDVPCEWRVLSAHRAPDLVVKYAQTAQSRGIRVIIAGAGGSAHLAGVIAANTTLPVIGVPMESKSLKGLDSLLSTVQMPSGVPVATVAINGAVNAAILAVQCLALSDDRLEQALDEHKRALKEKTVKADQAVQEAPQPS